MSYELDDLITMFRQDMMDQVEPYLWSEGEVLRYLAEAQDTFMDDTDYLAATETFSYFAGDLEVSFPSYITKVRHARAADESPLDVDTKVEWDEHKGRSAWRSDTGNVDTIISDLATHSVRLYPIPVVDGSFQLDVYRVAKTFVEDEEELEVTDRSAQRVILLGARAQAYSKEDPETLDEAKALKYSALFELKSSDWYARTQNARRRTRTVAYGGL